jgi:hypothetical protein
LLPFFHNLDTLNSYIIFYLSLQKWVLSAKPLRFSSLQARFLPSLQTHGDHSQRRLLARVRRVRLPIWLPSHLARRALPASLQPFKLSPSSFRLCQHALLQPQCVIREGVTLAIPIAHGNGFPLPFLAPSTTLTRTPPPRLVTLVS